MENPRLHEAGYDAFITGYVFAKTFSTLESEEQLKLSNSINSMRSLYYVKNGGYGFEEPSFKSVSRILKFGVICLK